MGVYFGPKYIAVIDNDNLDNCRVEPIDLKPEPKPLCEPETYYAPVPSDLKEYPLLERLDEAKDVVLRHVLAKCQVRILELIFAIEELKLRVNAAKRLKNKSELVLFEDEVSTIEPMQLELKKLKKIRNRKVIIC